MFLKRSSRRKNGKEHHYWSLVENKRVSGGRVVHRHGYEHSAMGDLLGGDFRLAADDTLYRCLDLLLEHKAALFTHLTDKWKDLFNAKFEVLLYDLTRPVR
jgi:hypothetical protein